MCVHCLSFTALLSRPECLSPYLFSRYWNYNEPVLHRFFLFYTSNWEYHVIEVIQSKCNMWNACRKTFQRWNLEVFSVFGFEVIKNITSLAVYIFLYDHCVNFFFNPVLCNICWLKKNVQEEKWLRIQDSLTVNIDIEMQVFLKIMVKVVCEMWFMKHVKCTHKNVFRWHCLQSTWLLQGVYS